MSARLPSNTSSGGARYPSEGCGESRRRRRPLTRRTPGGWAGEDRLLLPDQDEAHCRADATPAMAGSKSRTGLMAAVSDCVQALRAPRTGGCLQVESDASVVKDRMALSTNDRNP